MPKIYSYAQMLDADVVDAFCELQKGFSDQFVYYDKRGDARLFGLGRCIALGSMGELEYATCGPSDQSPILFSFKRFDASNPKPADNLFSSFPQLRFLLPEVVLIDTAHGALIQVNSLGPVHPDRVGRFAQRAAQAPPRTHRDIPFVVYPDSREHWQSCIKSALDAIGVGVVSKVVLSRRLRLTASQPFSSTDLVTNLIDGSADGTVFMYRYGDVFFVGCTPELLVRKRSNRIESMCLAGTIPTGDTPQDTERLAQVLLKDSKNRAEHAFVVDFMRHVIERNCHAVDIPDSPGILSLPHVQHLHTPVSACVMDGRSIQSLAGQLHPTPALAGTPVGEAMMLIRQIEDYNRGFYGGSVGYVDAQGDGQFSVAIRSGVFDGYGGWVYAGCGIVGDSRAAEEFDEIDHKLKTILSAFEPPSS